MLGRALKSDWIRMLANVKFWLAIPGVALLNWLTVADEWNLARQESSLVYFLVSKEGLGVFFILITLMAALPFGGCFLEDKRSRFFRYCLERGSLPSYCISKVVTAYVGAFLCVFLGDCLIFGILGTGVPFLTESQVEFQVFSQSRYYGTMTQGAPILYCIMEFSSEASGYAFSSMIAFLVSIYSSNSFVVLSSPILFYYGSMMLYQLLKLPAFFDWQNIRQNSFLFAGASSDFQVWGMTLLYFLAGAAVFGILFYLLLKRRMENIV